MCTAISFRKKDHYFGRNLDLELSYGEEITITPRNFPLKFRKAQEIKNHFAMIGVALICENYPLYFDAVNEYGLGMAGLNFPGNAHYMPLRENADNISPFELIPWVLSRCKSVSEARELLGRINIAQIPFSEKLPLSPLHWIVSDKSESLTVESVCAGLKIYDNPVGVLTNNPTFDMQMFNLNNYMSLSANPPKNSFSDKINLEAYSRGMGAMGLPGDLSSASRFIRAAFTKLNSVCGDSEEEAVTQFFHILYSVYQQRGCVNLGNDTYEITRYSSCCNTDRGIYYYTTYENSSITGVDMHKENLDGDELVAYPFRDRARIFIENKNQCRM